MAYVRPFSGDAPAPLIGQTLAGSKLVNTLLQETVARRPPLLADQAV